MKRLSNDFRSRVSTPEARRVVHDTWPRQIYRGNGLAERNNNLLAVISEVGASQNCMSSRSSQQILQPAMTMQTCRNNKLNLFATAQCPVSTAICWCKRIDVLVAYFYFFFRSFIWRFIWHSLSGTAQSGVNSQLKVATQQNEENIFFVLPCTIFRTFLLVLLNASAFCEKRIACRADYTHEHEHSTKPTTKQIDSEAAYHARAPTQAVPSELKSFTTSFSMCLPNNMWFRVQSGCSYID